MLKSKAPTHHTQLTHVDRSQSQHSLRSWRAWVCGPRCTYAFVGMWWSTLRRIPARNAGPGRSATGLTQGASWWSPWSTKSGGLARLRFHSMISSKILVEDCLSFLLRLCLGRDEGARRRILSCICWSSFRFSPGKCFRPSTSPFLVTELAKLY